MGSVEAMKEGSKDRYFQDVEDDVAIQNRWKSSLQRGSI